MVRLHPSKLKLTAGALRTYAAEEHGLTPDSIRRSELWDCQKENLSKLTSKV